MKKVCEIHSTDILSLMIYFFMWRHFKATVNVSEEGGSVCSQPYGGIYVGPEEVEVQVDHPAHNNNDEDHKAKSVMRALGLHAKLALSDLSLACLSIFTCKFSVAMSFFYICQIICFFWLPFFVIKAGFKQLRRFNGLCPPFLAL